MTEICNLMLHEHTGPCADPEHRAALERRAAGAPKWGKIERRYAHGDIRDYLEGEPIHCGNMLELQSVEYKGDDYGEWMVYLDKSVRVRFELSANRNPVLYASIGGHTFTARLEAWMRFRWKQ
jgi:hypothetical protein